MCDFMLKWLDRWLIATAIFLVLFIYATLIMPQFMCNQMIEAHERATLQAYEDSKYANKPDTPDTGEGR